jgi:cystathionine beta-lyase/cystathionine gamma-synthase
MVWLETPSNPTLTVIDIRAVAAAAKSRSKDIVVVVDNTFLSPVFQVFMPTRLFINKLETIGFRG